MVRSVSKSIWTMDKSESRSTRIENDMGARPTRKKHESQREEKTSSSLFLSLSSRARHVLTPTKNGHVGHCPILSRLHQNGRRIQIQCSNSCARELEIPTEFRRDTTQSEKQQQQQKEEDERKERRDRKRTFARRCCARGLCLFCSEN